MYSMKNSQYTMISIRLCIVHAHPDTVSTYFEYWRPGHFVFRIFVYRGTGRLTLRLPRAHACERSRRRPRRRARAAGRAVQLPVQWVEESARAACLAWRWSYKLARCSERSCQCDHFGAACCLVGHRHRPFNKREKSHGGTRGASWRD